MNTNRMGLEQEDDYGLSAQLEVLEAMTAPGDAENQQLICLLLELKRRRVNQAALESELQEYRKAMPAHEATDFQVSDAIAHMENEADMVLVPRGLLGAAAGAIRHPRHEAGVTLGSLRHYSHRKPITPQPAPLLQSVPTGWKLVPIEPTENMVVEGFESEPDSFFSNSDEWEAYKAMSGCQQAAHKARLCWAAMIAAAPSVTNEP